MRLQEDFRRSPVYFNSILTEGEKGCLMLKIPSSDAFKILEWGEQNIPECILAQDGREREVHITVAYGFNNVVSSQDFINLIKPIRFELGRVSSFPPNKEKNSTVIKVDVISDDLKNLHYKLREVFGPKLEVTFPDYKAHLTLAYCQSDKFPSQIEGCSYFQGMKFTVSDYIYSYPGRVRKEGLRAAN